MKKLTFSELTKVFTEHNEKFNVAHNGADEHNLLGVIVFKSENWPDQDYSLESRSYVVSSDSKYFIPGMCGNSIFSSNLDGTDTCIKLSDYMFGSRGWKIDYCYLK